MPVLAHLSKWYGIKDAKITPLLTDPAGGPATYGTAIDVPSIKSALVTGNVVRKKLRGDCSPIDEDAYLESIEVKFVYGQESLNVRAAALGGTTTDSGTTPAQIARWRLLGTDPLFPYYKFEGVTCSTTVGIGDAHLVLWKCKTVSFPAMGFADEDYHTYEVDAAAFPRIADSFWVDELYNETAVAIT